MNSDLSKIIGKRINTLLAEQDKKQKELAAFLGVPDNTISYFVSGRRTPNTEQLAKIADFFNVSADYLLGRTNAKTTDKDVQFVCDYTGLTTDAADILHFWHTWGGDYRIIPIVNLLIESEKSKVYEEIQNDQIINSLSNLNKIGALTAIEAFIKLNPNKNDRQISVSESGKLVSLSETYQEYGTHLSVNDIFSVLVTKESKIIEKVLFEFMADKIKELKKDGEPHGNDQ